MSLTGRIKLVGEAFSFTTPRDRVPSTSTKLATVLSNTVKFIRDMSQFEDMDEPQISEQLYRFDGPIGASIDRTSTMVSKSLNRFISLSKTSKDPLLEEMLEVANSERYIRQQRQLLEKNTELLMMHGNVYGEYNNDETTTTYPNRYVTFVSDRKMVDKTTSEVITDPKLMCVYEKDNKNKTKEISKDNYFHIKYKDTPLFETDSMGRETFGIYSVSPLNRLIISVWWKRQVMMSDMLLRFRMVPREHHALDSEMFNLSNFAGTREEKIAASTAAIEAAISSYKNGLIEQDPDAGFVSLDNTKINILGSNLSYSGANDFVKQLDDESYVALNVPKSIVSGESVGSYASEVAVGNYVSDKFIQIASKFEDMILRITKEKLLKVNSNYPVHLLSVKFEVLMASSRIEIFRQAAIMVSLGLFTDIEIRDVLGYMGLTEEQKDQVIMSGREKSNGDIMRDVSRATEVPSNPQTPQSDEQHKQDAGQQIINNV